MIKNWEYLVVDARRDCPPRFPSEEGGYGKIDTASLDVLGEQGWELVTVIDNGETCIFKRPVEQ